MDSVVGEEIEGQFNIMAGSDFKVVVLHGLL
jgi:hypothetical protein